MDQGRVVQPAADQDVARGVTADLALNELQADYKKSSQDSLAKWLLKLPTAAGFCVVV